MSHLSGIIFSNAATLGKFNRMGFLAGWRPSGLAMIRTGILFDRTPGAVEPIDFSLDVLSEEYAAMWLRGEQWCQELEVFHNPMATHPIRAYSEESSSGMPANTIFDVFPSRELFASSSESL
jgi:hypothetical protein